MFAKKNSDGYQQPLAGIDLKTLVYGENTSMHEFRMAEGSNLPPHSHPHEQISMLVEGEFELTVGEETRRLTQGMVVTIPPDVVHGGRALKKSYHIDIFYPVREDYL